MSNFFRFGTLIWTSSINLPDYDWALMVLKSIETAQQTANIWQYLTYFMFIFVDPALMGYIMLIPLSIGLFFALKWRMEIFTILLLFGIISTSIILSRVIISLSYLSIPCYNPRDIFSLAPFLTTLSTIGIVAATYNFYSKSEDGKDIHTPLLFVAYFGLLSYIHSVLVWYISKYHVTIVSQFVSSFGFTLGLTLNQTSFQLSAENRVIFISENLGKVIALSLIAGAPLLAVMVCRRYNILVRVHSIFVKIRIKSKSTLKLPVHLGSKKRAFAKSAVVGFLITSIIVIPRLELLIVQGGIHGIAGNQLGRAYGVFAEFITNKGRELQGGILTFRAPTGLPYYLPGVKVIDLTYPANLAFLKDCLLSSSPYETVVKLRALGVNYLLVNPSITQELDTSLNLVISKIMQNPELAVLSQNFGSWSLYTLGPYTTEKTIIPLSDWLIDPRYTNASYVFTTDESHLFLELHPTDANSRVTIVNRNVPKLNLSNYDYITIKFEGARNARIFVRFFLNDGSSFDVAYWKEPYVIMASPFGLTPYFEKTLRGDAYIGLKSSDETPTSINILEISFVKIRG